MTDFLNESRSLLGNQQYQQLQDLKNRPVAPQQQQQQQQSQQIRMQASNGMGDNTDANGRKRAGMTPDTPPQL
jgi:hypothetical protein